MDINLFEYSGYFIIVTPTISTNRKCNDSLLTLLGHFLNYNLRNLQNIKVDIQLIKKFETTFYYSFNIFKFNNFIFYN